MRWTCFAFAANGGIESKPCYGRGPALAGPFLLSSTGSREALTSVDSFSKNDIIISFRGEASGAESQSKAYRDK